MDARDAFRSTFENVRFKGRYCVPVRGFPINVVLLLLLSSCASVRAQPGAANSLLVARGREVAQLRCASCHSIDGLRESPRAPAPAFPELAMRFNALSWERKMREIAEGGHDEMPPLALPDGDVGDLRAFMQARP